MSGAASDRAPWRSSRAVMGTVASLDVRSSVDDAVIERAANAAFDELQRLEATFSTYRSTSAVSRFSRGDLALHDLPVEVLDVFDACTWLDHQSAGAFSMHRADGSVDPAGLVKGWAAERAAAMLPKHGIRDWALTVGGDVTTSGWARPGRRWTAAIADPTDPMRVAMTVVLPPGGAIATSGGQFRGAHIRRAADDDGMLSMSVIGPSLTWADAFSTAAYALGRDGLDWVGRFPDYRAIALFADGTCLSTASSPECVSRRA